MLSLQDKLQAIKDGTFNSLGNQDSILESAQKDLKSLSKATILEYTAIEQKNMCHNNLKNLEMVIRLAEKEIRDTKQKIAEHKKDYINVKNPNNREFTEYTRRLQAAEEKKRKAEQAMHEFNTKLDKLQAS